MVFNKIGQEVNQYLISLLLHYRTLFLTGNHAEKAGKLALYIANAI